MPVLIKLLFLTATLWTAVYSTSYTLCRLKKRHIAAAAATILLTVLMLGISIFSLFGL